MSRWSRDGRDIARDLCIAFKTDEYRDADPLDALADLKARRQG